MKLTAHETIELHSIYAKEPRRARYYPPRVWLFYDGADTIQVDVRNWSVSRLRLDPHAEERAAIAEACGCIETARRAYESGDADGPKPPASFTASRADLLRRFSGT